MSFEEDLDRIYYAKLNKRTKKNMIQEISRKQMKQAIKTEKGRLVGNFVKQVACPSLLCGSATCHHDLTKANDTSPIRR